MEVTSVFLLSSSSQLHSGDICQLPQTGSSVGKEGPVAFTEEASSQGAILFNRAIATASAPAQGEVGALLTGGIHPARLLQEAQGFPSLFNLLPAVCEEIPQTEGVQHVEIAGIDGTVRLYNVLDAANASHSTGLRRITQQHFNVVLELADGGRSALQGILIPEVKQIA